MDHHMHRLAWLVVLLALTSEGKEQSRWSRQISSYTADISDWVPLTGPVQREFQSKPSVTPIKRQAVAEPRILTEPFPGFTRPTGFSQESFPSRTYFNSPTNRQLYLQSVPSAPQNYLTDQGFGQSIRFGLSQPNFVNPLNQGFISPQFTFDNPPPPVMKQPIRPPHPPANPIKFENYPKQNIAPGPQLKPFVGQATKHKPEAPKFIDGYRFENVTDNFAFNKQKAQSLQKLKFENDQLPKTENIPSKPKLEREEVQLLYVPLESLNKGQFNFKNPMTSSHIMNSDFYSQGLAKPDPIKQTFAADYQRPVIKPIETFGSGQQYYSNIDTIKNFDQIPKFSTLTSPFPTTSLTTPKPKKLKPHQPPLAIFQETKKSGQIKVGDVLSSLKNANTIAVLDSVNPSNAPKVFIGPSSLSPPENFVKFELPYLSNIDNIDKKLRQLPFFVAPLSYNTPQGFAKIPFPSPHVGSVVINSLIKENTPSESHTLTTPKVYTTQAILSTPSASIIPNSFPDSVLYKKEQKPATQKPNFNYYSTISPKTNAPLNQQSNYYSFEPQSLSSISPQHQPEPINTAPQKGSYFLTNVGDNYNPSQFVNFPSQNSYGNPDPVKSYTVPKPETTTLRTTTTATTSKPSTFSSQLLETHNPYSINQAFHFSTPLDYHNYFDDFKDTYPPPGVSLEPPKSTQRPVSSTPILPSKSDENLTERPKQQTSPNYVQNYSPEIQYESDIRDSRYPVFNANVYTTKTELTSEQHLTTKPPSTTNIQPGNNQTPEPEYNGDIVYQTPGYKNLTETIINRITGPSSDVDTSNQQYDLYDNYNSGETRSSTSTTSTRRSPIRSRGRPRYTTAKTDSNEATTRAPITRRPLTQRRTLPPRSKYEPNKISAEKTTKKPTDSDESTTKFSRTRVRGRVQYKPSQNDEHYDRRNKLHNSKEDDIAYQRDILHQNYPVTLMERASTVDIEAITEPSLKISSTKTIDSETDAYDTENAYAHESAAISQIGSDFKDEIPNYTSRVESDYEDISVPKHSSTRSEENYQSRSSIPTQSFTSSDDSLEKHGEYPKQTSNFKVQKPEIISYATEPIVSNTEQPSYSISYEQSSSKQEDLSTNQDIEITKVESQESIKEEEQEENIVQTTPSYNRVRIRPGVIRQYHQTSSTESTRSKLDRRRPIQAVTYRPAFDRRRTTMRIEEIEADLKTKQVHTRPEVQEHRHPVYKPEPSTESSPTSSSNQDTTLKRGHFRRRRPTYSTTTTEASSTKRVYEVKNRFRGRRPTTERPTEKTEVQTEALSTTAKNTYSRYSHRPRLSERFNKKPEPETEESEDQDSNYSINRPKYVTPDSEQWSPKITSESFKPYNPNDIAEEAKIATTERRSDRLHDAELDIITARNDYDDILISVTPSSNNRDNKKIPDIPPTLEALVEQSKTTKSDTRDTMSTFETMLEEVMKSLEEQDENEYTSHVMKHKGGEIGEIPPERIISSGEDIAAKTTTVVQQEITTAEPMAEESTDVDEDNDRKSRRRGFWKKVKVRPISTESIDVAESQYYPNTVNRLGETVKFSKTVHDKSGSFEKPKLSITTYKPTFQFITDMFGTDEAMNEASAPDTEALLDIDISKIDKEVTPNYETTLENQEENQKQTTQIIENKITTIRTTSVGDEDLATGSPDPTLIDDMYFSTPTETTSSETVSGILDKSDSFSIMDYLFGTSSSDHVVAKKNITAKDESKITTKANDIEVTTEQVKPKIVTTETSYIPEEITAAPTGEDNTENITEFSDIKKIIDEEKSRVTETTESSINQQEESSSVSSFMHPSNVISTSMSTEVSHETEICFRGKCIKTSKDIL